MLSENENTKNDKLAFLTASFLEAAVFTFKFQFCSSR